MPNDAVSGNHDVAENFKQLRDVMNKRNRELADERDRLRAALRTIHDYYTEESTHARPMASVMFGMVTQALQGEKVGS